MRILFAEDDRDLRASVARGLKEAGYDVEAVSSGERALVAVEEGSYDLLLLDVLLPGKSGLEVCSAIRRSGHRMPILMLTALDAIEQRIAGLDAGADDYLTKPFDFGELLARLRALGRRTSDASQERLAVGDLVIEPARRAVHRGGRSISLTGKEYAFLFYLAQHAGRVVTRSELMSHVWDDSESYSNIIDVYAGRLRRKIDEGESVQLFNTLRGVGFILEAPAPGRKARRPATRAGGRRE
jgi:two-component system copper resistance phosphate regulon response regulator CusR